MFALFLIKERAASYPLGENLGVDLLKTALILSVFHILIISHFLIAFCVCAKMSRHAKPSI